jgi:hypothetical protein
MSIFALFVSIYLLYNLFLFGLIGQNGRKRAIIYGVQIIFKGVYGAGAAVQN